MCAHPNSAQYTERYLEVHISFRDRHVTDLLHVCECRWRPLARHCLGARGTVPRYRVTKPKV
jgi:hypothetical protein